MNYSIIIPLTERNISIIPYTIKYLKKNIEPKNIIIIANINLKEKCKQFDCQFFDENMLFTHMNYNIIKKIINKKDPFATKRTGWYFQQFIKMSYSLLCDEEFYLVWDADTIPITPIKMFDETDKPCFDIKDEYHVPYFTLIEKLFDGAIKKSGDYSFISEHMIIDKNFMKELINSIELNTKLEGKYYFEKILNTILKIDLSKSGFSEFETYGNFVLEQHSHAYTLRKLKSLRDGEKVVDSTNIDKCLEYLSKEYQIISIENRNHKFDKIERSTCI